MVSKLKQQELVKTILETPEFMQTPWVADILVDRIIELGWVPIEDFPDEEYPAPTQPVVNDIMERIISGLPERAIFPPQTSAHMDEIEKLYDVASLHPQDFTPDFKMTDERKADELIKAANSWKKIPDFDNYEVNPLGVIRSRWTKRVIEVTEDGEHKYVAMHDGQGFEHAVNVNFVMEKVYKKK